jgi:hypothetical protein
MKIKSIDIPGIKSLFIFLLGVAVVSCLNSRAESTAAAEEKVPGGGVAYIDAHNHLAGRFGPLSRQVLDYEGAARAALAAMDRYGIEKMLIMPPPLPHNC